MNTLIYFSHGLIPNGGRVYYLRRSQPPMLTPMMYEYLAVTGDMYFLRDNIQVLEQEYKFWMTNRSVQVMIIIFYIRNV